jgi:predicted nuclease of predicted toxin-antitoxin system
MRFLANENFPGDAVDRLKAAGHDVAWVRTVAPGSSDEAVLARAVREERIVLTLTRTLVSLRGAQDCPPPRA